MLGKIAKWAAVVICSMVAGWITCLLFQCHAPFVLDWEMGMADVLSIVVDIILACVIAGLIEKNINNNRVEKDYFISELDSVNDIFTDLEKTCSSETTLSLQNITYDIGRSRKILQKSWKMMKEVNNPFQKANQKDFSFLLEAIKQLDGKLTDTSTFKEADGYSPVKINRNHIYLNDTVKPEIDRDLTAIKERIFQLKIKINRI